MSTEAVTALARYITEDRVSQACELLRQDALPKLEMMVAEIANIASLAVLKPITNDAEAGRAAELINRGERAMLELTALRRKHVDPLNNEVKAINGLFKSLTDPCEALVGKGGPLEKMILLWRAQERARIKRQEDEAQQRREEAARKEGEALAKAEAATTEFARRKALAVADQESRKQTSIAFSAPLPMTRGIRTDAGTLTESARWTFEVVSPKDVPREFLCPDEKAIRAAVAGGVRQIAGVYIHEQEGLTRRR